MFIIDQNNNAATAVAPQTFAGLGFREVSHLQEWIRKNPSMLGEELLIIQKEFAGFEGTSMRLDLLALDKKGNLVVIENKRDDSGKDITGQALKYVSFFSTATQQKIVQIFQEYLDEHFAGTDAEKELCNFFGTEDFSEIPLLNEEDRKNDRYQRIILVAGDFRPEVTSTVLWLLKHKVKIQCIKTTLYKYGENVFIDTEQIIPVKEVEEYQGKLAQKRQQDSIAMEAYRRKNELYSKFWHVLLQRMNENSTQFRDLSLAKFREDNPALRSLSCESSRHRGMLYKFSLYYPSQPRVVLIVQKGSKDFTKQIFDDLHKRKLDIESAFGAELNWEWDEKRSRGIIAHSLFDANVPNEDNWDKSIEFFIEYMPRFEAAMSDALNEVLADESETTSPE
jgi:hypothetical protein